MLALFWALSISGLLSYLDFFSFSFVSFLLSFSFPICYVSDDIKKMQFFSLISVVVFLVTVQPSLGWFEWNCGYTYLKNVTSGEWDHFNFSSLLNNLFPFVKAMGRFINPRNSALFQKGNSVDADILICLCVSKVEYFRK